MNDPIPSPLRGRSIIDWAVPVTQRLNALRDKVGASSRNERDRRPQAPDLTCFRIAHIEYVYGGTTPTGDPEPTEATVYLAAPWFSIGGKAYQVPPPAEEDEEGDGEESEDEEGEPQPWESLPRAHLDAGTGFVCLRVDIGALVTEPTGELIWVTRLNRQYDMSEYVYPLWRFEDWRVAVDLRTAPCLTMTEF